MPNIASGTKVQRPLAAAARRLGVKHIETLYVEMIAAARDYTASEARPWFASGVARAVDDPFVQHRYGELWTLLRPAVVLADHAGCRVVFDRNDTGALSNPHMSCGGSMPGEGPVPATLTRRQMHVRNAVIGALIYPALLVTVAVAVLATMLLFVLPRFAGLFETLDVPLPPTTQLLMAMSDFLRSYWWSGEGWRF